MLTVYLALHSVSVWAVGDSWWLLSQLFAIHGCHGVDGEGIQILNRREEGEVKVSDLVKTLWEIFSE